MNPFEDEEIQLSDKIMLSKPGQAGSVSERENQAAAAADDDNYLSHGPSTTHLKGSAALPRKIAPHMRRLNLR